MLIRQGRETLLRLFTVHARITHGNFASCLHIMSTLKSNFWSVAHTPAPPPYPPPPHKHTHTHPCMHLTNFHLVAVNVDYTVSKTMIQRLKENLHPTALKQQLFTGHRNNITKELVQKQIRSKHIKGSKECRLLEQNTTCKFSGQSALSSYKMTLKQQLNGEKQF